MTISTDGSSRPSREFVLKDLKRSEKFLKIKFPEDIWNFFLQYAGCFPEPNTFNIDSWIVGDGPQVDNIDRFIGSEDDSLSDLLSDMRDILRHEYLPFAECSSGNLVCYSLDYETMGSIWYWNHDDMGEDNSERANSWSYYKCSETLQEFVDGIYEFDDTQHEVSTENYDFEPEFVAYYAFWEGVEEALRSVFKKRPDFVEEHSCQWTREYPTVYQTIVCNGQRLRFNNTKPDDERCVQIFVNFSPKAPFAVWKNLVDKKRFVTVLKKLLKFTEYHWYLQAYDYYGFFFSEHPLDTLLENLDKNLDKGWRERNDRTEMKQAFRGEIERIIDEDVAHMLSYCDKYKGADSLYEGYLKGELPLEAVRFANIPYELYLSTWLYTRNQYDEALGYIDSYLACFEKMPECHRKNDLNACCGKFAKYIHDYLAPLIESSK